MSNNFMFNLQDASSVLMEQLLFFHDHSMFFLIFVLSLVGLCFISLLLSNYINSYLLMSEWVETLWTLLPGVILVFILIPSLQILYLMDEVLEMDVNIKIIGHQWYWSYEYPDFNIQFDSYMNSEYYVNYFRLLDVDNRMVVPSNVFVRLIVTSSDVIHSWTVPSLGLKVDANPGRLNQLSFNSGREGLFFGQCSEMCGALHSYMPICVEVVNMPSFVRWLSSWEKNK